MIERDQIKRGFRFKNPYRGTVVEVVEAIPDDCPCPDYIGKPGVLVHWDFACVDGEVYPDVIPAWKLSLRSSLDNLGFIPIDRLLMADPL